MNSKDQVNKCMLKKKTFSLQILLCQFRLKLILFGEHIELYSL